MLQATTCTLCVGSLQNEMHIPAVPKLYPTFYFISLFRLFLTLSSPFLPSLVAVVSVLEVVQEAVLCRNSKYDLSYSKSICVAPIQTTYRGGNTLHVVEAMAFNVDSCRVMSLQLSVSSSLIIIPNTYRPELGAHRRCTLQKN